MSTPDEPIATPSDYNGEGGERLLIHEVRSLGQEVSRLRGDTKHLNDVIVPREEHARRRRVYGRLAALSLAVLLVTLASFGYLLHKVNASQDQFRQISYESCLARNNTAKASAEGAQQVNALLVSLRDSETGLLKGSQLAQFRDRRVKAYNDYLAFVARASQPDPNAPKLPACSTFKR